MLLTDQEYPRGYGDNHGLLYYIVAAPDTRPLFVEGYTEAAYRIAGPGIPSSEDELLRQQWVRMPLPANMREQVTKRQRRRHAAH